MKTLVDSYDVEEFLSGSKGNGSGVNRNYINSDGLYDEDTILDTPDTESLPSFPNSNKSTYTFEESNLFKPLEAQLHSSSPKSVLERNLPSINVDNNINTTTEDLGVEDKYKGSTFIGMHSPSPWS